MSRLRVRVSVSASTPDLYTDLSRIEEIARPDRLKHLAALGLLFLSHRQPTGQLSQPIQQVKPETTNNKLSNVVNRLMLSLNE